MISIMNRCLPSKMHPKCIYCPSRQLKKLKSSIKKFRVKKKECKSRFSYSYWEIKHNIRKHARFGRFHKSRLKYNNYQANLYPDHYFYNPSRKDPKEDYERMFKISKILEAVEKQKMKLKNLEEAIEKLKKNGLKKRTKVKKSYEDRYINLGRKVSADNLIYLGFFF